MPEGNLMKRSNDAALNEEKKFIKITRYEKQITALFLGRRLVETFSIFE